MVYWRAREIGLVLASTGFLSTQLLAAGYGIRTQSASHMGTAFSADGADSSDITAIFSNPAALGFLDGNRHAVGVTMIQSNVDFSNGEATNGPTGANTTRPLPSDKANDITDTSTIPFIYGSYSLSEKINIGWSITVPWATKTDYNDNWIGRYHGVETELVTYNFTPMMSYKINSNLVVAGGIQAQYAEGTLSSALDIGLSLASIGQPVIPGNEDGIATFEAKGWGTGAVIGILGKVDDVSIGLSYRSKVRHLLKGDATFSGQTRGAVLALAQQNLSKSDGETTITTPDVVTFGMAFEPLETMKVFTNATLTRWSAFDELDISYEGGRSFTEQNWKDSLYIAVGTQYQLDEKLALRGGLAIEQGAVSDINRTPRTPDSNRQIAALGAGYAVDESLSVDFSYSYIQFEEAELNLFANDYPENRGRGNLTGSYDNQAHVFMLQSQVAL